MEHSLQDYGAFPRHELPAFRPLRSTGDALSLVAAMTAFVGYILVSRLVPHSDPWVVSPPHEASANVVLFLVACALAYHVDHQHRKCQARGYLEFYRNTAHLRKAPPLILALGNAGLLVLWSFADSHDHTVRAAVLGLFLLEWFAVVLNNALYIRQVRSFNLQAPAADPVRLLGQPGDASPVPASYDRGGYSTAAADSPSAVPNVSTADLAMFWQQRAEDLQDRLYRLEEEGERGLRRGGRPGEDYAVVEERLRQEQQRAQAAHTKLDEAEKRRQSLQEEVTWLKEELQNARDEAEESAARAEQATLQRDRYEALLNAQRKETREALALVQRTVRQRSAQAQ